MRTIANNYNQLYQYAMNLQNNYNAISMDNAGKLNEIIQLKQNIEYTKNTAKNVIKLVIDKSQENKNKETIDV